MVAIFLGTLLLDYSGKEILTGFPGQMFILIVGITLLVAIAQSNGTVEWIVVKLLALAGGKLILLPWLLFITAFVASSLGPGAAPILFVIGAGFIEKFKLNPLLVELNQLLQQHNHKVTLAELIPRGQVAIERVLIAAGFKKCVITIKK
mgnify:CR=1 FL=1